MGKHRYRRSRHLAVPREITRSPLRRLLYVGAPLALRCPPTPWPRLILAWLRGVVLRLLLRAIAQRLRLARRRAPETPPKPPAKKPKRVRSLAAAPAQRSEAPWREPPRARVARLARRALPRSGRRGQ